jgi:hypothetical protein
VTGRPIDVWDCATFDPDLADRLHPHAALVVDYYRRDHAIFLSHDLGRGPGRALIRPDNRHAAAFQALREGLIPVLADRTIRAWHYTRMTDGEVERLRQQGPHPSTPATLHERLAALVEAGALDGDQAGAIVAASPFQTDQLESRRDKFWMTSHPIAVDDSGVEPLMAHWGGEVANMFLRDDALLSVLAATGQPRIVELAVPLRHTRHPYSAAEAVVATFARARGAIPAKQAFDLYIDTPLPAAAVLAVHTEGEPAFHAMGRSHPAGFVDFDIGRWKELTGEDD